MVGTATSEAGAEKLSASFAENGAGKVLILRDGAAIDALVSDIEQSYGSVLAFTSMRASPKKIICYCVCQKMAWDDISNIA